MFRRSSSDSADSTAPAAPSGATIADPAPGGAKKGRPTPSRKEAEAAAKVRAKPPRTKKELAAAKRKARNSDSDLMRAALKSGDERHLPARDRGPLKRFVRDYVDVRFSFIELLMPMMLVVLVLGVMFGSNQRVVETGNILLIGTLLLVIIDAFFLRAKLARELAARFPGESTKGTTYYAIMRAMQMRFMRLPKPKKKIGQDLDATRP